MPGGALVLAARNGIDVLLTGTPQRNYFAIVYERIEPFATEPIRQEFQGSADFGRKVYIEFDRRADLIQQIWLYINLPSLNASPEENPDYVVSWVNGIGNYILRTVDVYIGPTRIDTHYGQWMQIWAELTIPDEKRPAYNQLIGYTPSGFTAGTQPGPLQLRVPLFFWFNVNPGSALPLIQLSGQNVRLYVEFQDFESCWVSNTGGPPGLENESSSFFGDSGPHIVEAFAMVDYIYLGKEQRIRMMAETTRILIPQLQVGVYPIQNPDEIFQLTMKLPIVEVIWVFQKALNPTVDPVEAKDPFDFSDGSGNDPMIRARLRINNQEIYGWRDSIYHRIMQPFQYHTRVPLNTFIYMYSFALYPEKYQPSGTLNASATDNFALQTQVVNALPSTDSVVNVYGRSYNWLTFEKGMAFLAYVS